MAPLAAPLLVLAAAHAAAAAPRDTALVFEHVRSQCHSLLAETMKAGHSAFELGALCRARAPPRVCRAALGALGPAPWSPAAVHAACDDVQSQWRRSFLSVADPRALQDGSDVSSAIQLELDAAMRRKHQLGVCPDKPLDECAKYKATKYPEQAKDLEAVLKRKYQDVRDTGLLDGEAATGMLDDAATGVLPPPDQSESKFETVPSISQSGGDSSGGFWLGFAGGAAVAAMFVAFTVVRRGRQQCMKQGATSGSGTAT